MFLEFMEHEASPHAAAAIISVFLLNRCPQTQADSKKELNLGTVLRSPDLETHEVHDTLHLGVKIVHAATFGVFLKL